MKILFWMFIGFDHHETSEHLLCDIIKQLCRNGHSVHILQKQIGGPLPVIPECLANYDVTTELIPFQPANKTSFIARYLKELDYISRCRKHFKADCDAVFIQSTTVLGLAARAVRKMIPQAIITVNVQDIFPYNLYYINRLNGLFFRILACVQRIAYRKSDHIITISEDMKKTLVSDGADPNKIEVVYNWSYQDEPYINIDTSCVSSIFKKDCFNVVYAGNIGLMQNVGLCIEAARLMKDDKNIWFYIIGDGVVKKGLEDNARKYGISNISFLPKQPMEYAPAVYSSADVNVIPLAKKIYKTALPSKTATCIACRKPIVFAIGKESEFGGKIAAETNNLLVSSDDPNELVEAIRHLSSSKINDTNNRDFFVKYFKVSVNSKRYADIITSF